MKVFDCVLYCGEREPLLQRLTELFDVIDIFVIVEATRTFNGTPKTLHLRENWHIFRKFASKIRYIIVTDDIERGDAQERESFQKNKFHQGLIDADDSDLIYLSNIATIPTANSVRKLRKGQTKFEKLKHLIAQFIFYARKFKTPHEKYDKYYIAPYLAFKHHMPEQIDSGISEASIQTNLIDRSAFQLPYFANTLAINKNIASTLKTPSNTNEGLRKNGGLCVKSIQNMYSKNAHIALNSKHFYAVSNQNPLNPSQSTAFINNALHSDNPSKTLASTPRKVVIICPYVSDEDREQVVKAFGLDQPRGQHLPFFFWKDEKLIGPEQAYAHCWDQFPDSDIIIIHTDMRPMPEDKDNTWYTELCAQAAQLPDAGLIGCDLLYPIQSLKGNWYAQCAGGYFKNGQVSYWGGGVQLAEGTISADACEYDERFSRVRNSQWVTFGGVFIRREIIDMVGGFDSRYEWAYVMDVDYCLEAYIRGQRIYQVPVNLLHEESQTTKKFLIHAEYRAKQSDNMTAFYRKWAWLLTKLPNAVDCA